MGRTDSAGTPPAATLSPAEKQQFCQHIGGALNVLMMMLDGNGDVLLFNRAAERASGYSADVIVGRRLWNTLVAEEDRASLQDALRSLLEFGYPLEGEYKWRRSDGTHAYIRWSYSVARLDDGVRIFCTGTDLSDQEALQRALERRARALACSNRELEAFTSSLSHDLRSPLRAMSGLSRMLLEDYGHRLDGDATRYLERMHASALRTTKLVDSLLMLFKLSQQEIEYGDVDLTRVAGSVLGELQAQEPDRRVDVVVDSGMMAVADARLMELVLSNLLGNAWKYTRKTRRPRIRFGRRREGNRHVFYIADNGAGFDMALAGDLFKPFRRLHADGDFEGTGIGLTIVERIISSHGGDIWCESAPDQGSTFMFTLP